MQPLLESLADRLRNAATVRTVFGDPITVEGKTIIPVASIGFGFGGGFGTGQPGEPETKEQGRTGAGGGFGARPIGVVEVTADRTRFIPIHQTRRLALAFGAGLLIGLAAGRRGRCAPWGRPGRAPDLPREMPEID